MKRVFYSLLLVLCSVILYSCVEEADDFYKRLPSLNKNEFTNLGTNRVDTLFSTKEEIFIGAVSVYDAAADTLLAVGVCHHGELAKELVTVDGVQIGTISYDENGIVTFVDVFDLCTIRLVKAPAYKTAYKITPAGKNYDKRVTLHIENNGFGALVNIACPAELTPVVPAPGDVPEAK